MIFSKIDILIGGFDAYDGRAAGLNASISYMSDDLTWCFGRSNPNLLWSDLFAILTQDLWIAEILIVLINAMMLFHVTRLDGFFKDWLFYLLMSFFLQLGGPTYYNPHNSVVRWIYGINLVVGFMWNSIFNALWIGSLQRIFSETRFTSLTEIMGRQFNYRGTDAVIEYLVKVFEYENVSFAANEFNNI